MTHEDTIRKELEEVVHNGQEISTSIIDKDKEHTLRFSIHYQSWYTRALPLVRLLAPDRLTEFVSYYESDPRRKSLDAETYSLRDYARALVPPADAFGHYAFDYRGSAHSCLVNQINILQSLLQRVADVVSDFESRIISEFEDSELQVAADLVSISKRASGAIAGVVLERHLGRVAARHGVKTRKKAPTVGDYNDLLRQHGTYDLPTHRKIQYLADIRNVCCHDRKREPTEAETVELVREVQRIVKN